MQIWVDLGTAVKGHNSCPRLHITVVFAINTTVHDQILTLVFSHFCISFYIVCFCAGFYFFSTTPRDQLGRMCLKWSLLCQVQHEMLTWWLVALLNRWRRLWLCFMLIRPRRLPESEKWSKNRKRPFHFHSEVLSIFPLWSFSDCCSLLLNPQFVLLHICSFLELRNFSRKFFDLYLLPL